MSDDDDTPKIPLDQLPVFDATSAPDTTPPRSLMGSLADQFRSDTDTDTVSTMMSLASVKPADSFAPVSDVGVQPAGESDSDITELDFGPRLDPETVNILVEEATDHDRRSAERRAREENEARRQGRTIIRDRTAEDERQEGVSICQRVVSNLMEERKNAGEEVPSAEYQNALVEAVFNRLYRLGPLQPIVDSPTVENILINGDYCHVMRPDGSTEQIDSPFSSDTELVEWLRIMASKAGGGGREFAPVSPGLRLNLPGGIRLSAMNWTTERPSVAIRLHRHKNIDLQRLVELKVMDPRLAPILNAATSAGSSVVISGPMGAGKTTLLRALVAGLPVKTRIGTAETERELFLGGLPGRAPYVVSAEVMEGGGDRNPATGEKEGSFTLEDQLYEFVRQQLEIVIVGEVAGKEIVALFKAMQMAHGSMTTTHATDPRGAINRLVTCALEAGVTTTYAERQVAEHTNLIVQLNTKWVADPHLGRVSHRYISAVSWVEPDADSARPRLTEVYRGEPDGSGRFGTFPEPLREKLLGEGIGPDGIPANELFTRTSAGHGDET